DGVRCGVGNFKLPVRPVSRTQRRRKPSYTAVEDQLFLLGSDAQRRCVGFTCGVISALSGRRWKVEMLSGQQTHVIPLNAAVLKRRSEEQFRWPRVPLRNHAARKVDAYGKWLRTLRVEIQNRSLHAPQAGDLPFAQGTGVDMTDETRQVRRAKGRRPFDRVAVFPGNRSEGAPFMNDEGIRAAEVGRVHCE